VKDDLLRKVRIAAKGARCAGRRRGWRRNCRHPMNGGGGTEASATCRSTRCIDRASIGHAIFPWLFWRASTGGPATVMRARPRLHKDFPAAVILVQHMPAASPRSNALQLAEVSPEFA